MTADDGVDAGFADAWANRHDEQRQRFEVLRTVDGRERLEEMARRVAHAGPARTAASTRP